MPCDATAAELGACREGLLEKKLTDLKEGSANFLLFVEVRACSTPESARPPDRPTVQPTVEASGPLEP